MKQITDIVTTDAAYLSAVIEEFRGAESGNVQIPLASAEILLRNYTRVLGLLSRTSTEPKTVSQVVSMDETMAKLIQQQQEWFTKLKQQQDEAAAKAATLMQPPSAASPTPPPATGATP